MWLQIDIQVAQNDRTAIGHHMQEVLGNFEPPRPLYSGFSVQKWPFSASFEAVFRTIILKVQDDHQCIKQQCLDKQNPARS